jgi:hypothetical protein
MFASSHMQSTISRRDLFLQRLHNDARSKGILIPNDSGQNKVTFPARFELMYSLPDLLAYIIRVMQYVALEQLLTMLRNLAIPGSNVGADIGHPN